MRDKDTLRLAISDQRSGDSVPESLIAAGRSPSAICHSLIANRFVLVYLFTCLLAALCLSGCVTLTNLDSAQENSRDLVGVLTPGRSIGQVFVSRRSGLNSLTIWAGKSGGQNTPNPILTLGLYHSPQDTQSLNISQASIAGSGPVTVSLPPQRDPDGQAYYLKLETNTGQVQIYGQAGEISPSGPATIDGRPAGAAIAFRTTYDYAPAAMLQDLVGLGSSLWLVLPLAMVLLVPGWLLLNLSGLGRRFDGSQQVALSVGLSLAAIPLLMLWTSTLGLHWSRAAVLFAAGLLTAAVAWRLWKTRPSLHISTTFAVVALIFTASLLVRLAMVRDFAAPAWIDSVHHALITRLIMQNGAFPSTYAPYFDVLPTEYHAGFHSSLAAFQWLSGLDLQGGMLLFGQVLNALAVYAAYLLGSVLTGDRKTGAWAALIAGLFTPMPAYYTSWGRYTQLAGLIMLPAGYAILRLLVLKRFDQEGPSPAVAEARDYTGTAPRAPVKGLTQRSPTSQSEVEMPRAELLWGSGLAVVACAGLAIVHYRVAAFLACLLLVDYAALLARQAWERKAFPLALLRRMAGVNAAAALAAFLLTLPWMIPNLATAFLPVMRATNYQDTRFFSDFSWRYLNAGLGQYTLYLAGLGLLAGLLWRRGAAITLALWTALMFFLANLGAMRLPGGWFINNTSVEILLFLPISILGGLMISLALSAGEALLPPAFRRPAAIAIYLAGMLLAGYGAYNLVPLLNPATEIFRSGDRAAIAWAGAHIPAGETVLVNPFSWGYGVYAGNDGGYWLAPLTGLNTIPPPVLYGFGDSADRSRINTVSQEVLDHGADPNTLGPFLLGQKIHYVFIGVRGGVLSPSALEKSAYFKPLYASGGAWIFEVKSPLEDYSENGRMMRAYARIILPFSEYFILDRFGG